jgi:hypothetical protein
MEDGRKFGVNDEATTWDGEERVQNPDFKNSNGARGRRAAVAGAAHWSPSESQKRAKTPTKY